jgi:hypothetical protein
MIPGHIVTAQKDQYDEQELSSFLHRDSAFFTQENPTSDKYLG